MSNETKEKPALSFGMIKDPFKGKKSKKDYYEFMIDSITNITNIEGYNSSIYDPYHMQYNTRNQLPQHELLVTSQRTGKGYFATYQTVKETFKGEWQHVAFLNSGEELPLEVIQRIEKADRSYNIKSKIIQVTALARSIGHAAIIKIDERDIIRQSKNSDTYIPQVYPDKTKTEKLRIVPYNYSNLIYDPDDGQLSHLLVNLLIGNNNYTIKIPRSNFELFVNDPNPFVDGVIGESAIASSYYAIKSLMNLLEGYVKIVSQRGLSLVDITIDGATQPECDKYSEQFKDVSMFSSIAHNERMKVNVTAGIKSDFNLSEMMTVLTKEVSSGTGIGEALFNGVPMGRITGSETDQNKFAAVMKGIQSEYEPNIIRVFKMCDPALESYNWHIDYTIKIKWDRLKNAQIRAMDAATLTSLPELFSVNYARELMGMKLLDGEEGDKTIYQLNQEQMEKYSVEPQGNEFGNTAPPRVQSERKTNFKPKSNDPAKRLIYRQVNERSSKNYSAVKGTTDSLEDILNPEMFDKKTMARILLNRGISIPSVNQIIKDTFGSGMSNTDLVKIRNEGDK